MKVLPIPFLFETYCHRSVISLLKKTGLLILVPSSLCPVLWSFNTRRLGSSFLLKHSDQLLVKQ